MTVLSLMIRLHCFRGQTTDIHVLPDYVLNEQLLVHVELETVTLLGFLTACVSVFLCCSPRVILSLFFGIFIVHIITMFLCCQM